MMDLFKALEELHMNLEDLPSSSTEHVTNFRWCSNGHVVELMIV